MTEHEKRTAMEGRKAMRQFISRTGRKPSMAELDAECKAYKPEPEPVSKRTGKRIFRFAW